MATLLTRSGRKLGWRIHGFYEHCFFRCLAVGQSSNASVDNTSRHEVHIFAAKKARDILRAIFVLKLCSYDVFVRNNMWVCKVAYNAPINAKVQHPPLPGQPPGQPPGRLKF